MKHPDFIFKIDFETGKTIYTARKIFWRFYLKVSFPDLTKSISFLTKNNKL
jgi:hypothetical protein